MKTAKKLFSLLLVAVLLFSALPFQASADTNPEFYVNFIADGVLVDKVQVEYGTGKLLGSVPHAPAKEGYTWTGYDVRGEKMTVSPIKELVFQAAWFDNPTGQVRNMTVTAVYENNHPTCDFSNLIEDKLATCTAGGYKLYQCTSCSKTEKRDVTGVVDHTYGEAVVVPATDEAAGSSTRTCTVCGHQDVQILGQLTTTVTFRDPTGNYDDVTKPWAKGQAITVSDIPVLNDLVGKKFEGWYTRPDGLGQKLITGNWNEGKDYYATTYYAYFRESQYATGAGVTVYASVFSGSTLKNTVKLGQLAFQNGDYILSELMNNRQNYINNFFDYSGYSVADYEVADQAFYKNSLSTEKITDGTTVANGTTSVYIKIKAKNSATASVQLFVHTKVNSSYALYDLTDFVAGDQITDTYIKNFLKNKTGKNYSITGMYDQYNWDRLCNGFTSESNTRLEVPADGKLRIHIIAPSYTNANTSSKPASNPATGDYTMIEATAAVMILAAAAVVTLTQLRKRKMI